MIHFLAGVGAAALLWWLYRWIGHHNPLAFWLAVAVIALAWALLWLLDAMTPRWPGWG